MAVRSGATRHAAAMDFLYILTRSDAPGIVKIGRHADPVCHARELQAGHCFSVRVAATYPGAGEHAEAVHAALERRLVAPGTGWFRCSMASAITTIDDVIAEAGEAMREATRDARDAESDEDDASSTSSEHARFVRNFVDEHIDPVLSIARASNATDMLDTIAQRANMPTDVVADILEEDGWEQARCGRGRVYRMRDDTGIFARVRSRARSRARSRSPRRE